MSVLTDLAQLLEARGVGTLDRTIFRGGRPAQPDECLTLQTYSGDPNRVFSDTGVPALESHNVQVVARATNQGAAERLARQAFDAIQFTYELLNGNRYRHCRANHYPASIGVDENNRHLIAFNIRLTRLRTTGLETET